MILKIDEDMTISWVERLKFDLLQRAIQSSYLDIDCAGVQKVEH